MSKNGNIGSSRWMKWGMAAVVAAGAYSCANMSRPGGGPYDERPPVFVKSTPVPNATGVTKNKIEIEFDELIQLEKVSEKVIVSPPQKNMAEITASGRRVLITLRDTLLPNTTYTIDFSDAIVDNNEKNAIPGFSYAFTTGDHIDSLQVSGLVLNAADLEPVTGMLVGLHSQLDDSTFRTMPLERIATTDAYGRFSIKNVSPGSYRIYALKDMNRDFRFDNASEDIAFLDEIIVPSAEPHLHTDTIWADSVTIDTIVTHNLTRFFPNDIFLSAFNEDFKSQYLLENTRSDRRRIALTFAAPAQELPRLEPLNFERPDWAVIERSATFDTLSYWIKDSLIYKMDTLLFAAHYLRTDSARQLSPYVDTLRFIAKPERQEKKRRVRKNDTTEVKKTVFVTLNEKIPSVLDVYSPVAFSFDEPIAAYDRSMIRLEEKQDTLWIPVPESLYGLVEDTLTYRHFTLSHKWTPDGAYRLSIDSTAFTGLYGNHTDRFSKEFKIKPLSAYANLFVEIQGVQDSAYVELLNKQDVPVRRVALKEGGAEFMYLAPDTYYLRLFIDRNGNGEYDTGNFAEHRQPEEVFYYHQPLALKANWDVEQTWNIFEKPVDMQKPNAIKKNKPKFTTTRRQR